MLKWSEYYDFLHAERQKEDFICMIMEIIDMLYIVPADL
jgi:hypothetical protein